MKLLDLVNKAIKDGYKIKYRIRTDGGIIVSTINGVKYRLKTYGEREAIDYLNRMEQRAMGYAYDENIEHLAFEIEQKGKSSFAQDYREEFEELAQKVRNKKPFYDKWIYPSYQALYNCRTQNQCQDTINEIKRICQL